MMRTFTMQELPERHAEFAAIADLGNLSVVTDQGHRAFIMIPMSDDLKSEKVNVSLAVKLFEDGALTPGRAARIAEMTLIEFYAYVSAQGIPVVDYDPSELALEFKTLGIAL